MFDRRHGALRGFDALAMVARMVPGRTRRDRAIRVQRLDEGTGSVPLDGARSTE
jgi:hypothetical protein